MADSPAAPLKPVPEEPRRDHEPPAATARLGWRYHYLGVPTAVPRHGEQYLPEYKLRLDE